MEFIASVLVYKKKIDSQSIACYVSPRCQNHSCVPSLSAPYLPWRDLCGTEATKDWTQRKSYQFHAYKQWKLILHPISFFLKHTSD